MNKYFFVIVLFFLYGGGLVAQIVKPLSIGSYAKEMQEKKDSIDKSNGIEKVSPPGDSLKIFRTQISDYQIWYENKTKQQVDTALTLASFYKQNSYKRDLFDYQQFPNIGQALNPLTLYTIENNLQLLPTGKSFTLVREEEIPYYNVKTPTTIFQYENGVEEGQALSTTFTYNPSAQFNFTFNYRGTRSQGRYDRQLASVQDFILSSNYHSRNNRYSFKTNYVIQNINNQENGGVNEDGIIAFINNDSNYSNRENMTTNLLYSESKYEDRTFRFTHQYGLFSLGAKKDSLAQDSLQKDFPIYIKHKLTYKKQDYSFDETSAESYYTSDFVEDAELNNNKYFSSFRNEWLLGIEAGKRLKVEGGLLYDRIKLSYDSAYTVGTLTVPQQEKEGRFGFLGNIKFSPTKKINLRANAEYSNGSQFGNQYFLNAQTDIELATGYQLVAGLQSSTQFPSLNLYSHQSFYTDFNYQNTGFKNETRQKIYGQIRLDKFKLSLFGNYQNLNNYVYVSSEYTPTQLASAINYFVIGANKQLKWKKWRLDTRVQYQKVLNNQSYYPLPDINARATLYYQNTAFQRNLFYQTGITAHYYSKFKSREFFPVINEFMLPTTSEEREIGNYPQIDAFFNFRIRRMRIYIRGENINSFFQRGKYFSTPNQPARDFKIQLGLFWYLFV